MLEAGKMLINMLAGGTSDDHVMGEHITECVPPAPGPHSAYIPNVTVRTHRDQVARFYDDLVLGRIVLINCMSVRDDASCSNMEIMARVQSMIGHEAGRSVFLYSITTDPVNDTPAVLRSAAQKYGAGNGWLFLTGAPADLALLRMRMFTHGGGDCSMHLIRYGNESAGLWGAVLARHGAEAIVERVSWVTPRERPSGPPIRGGPFPPVSEG